MLRTSLRNDAAEILGLRTETFLSSNAQDFIEDHGHRWSAFVAETFLSSNAQDFIEDF